MSKNNDFVKNIRVGILILFIIFVLLLIGIWAYFAITSEGIISSSFLIFVNIMKVLTMIILVVYLILLIPYKIGEFVRKKIKK